MTLFDSGHGRDPGHRCARRRACPDISTSRPSGAYDSARQMLIDNMSNAEGRAGYYVITPFALRGGGWILVNRGWVPVGASRADEAAGRGVDAGARRSRPRR